ncbi:MULTISPECIES: RusA family crossover junction endodeoxyribonuclease [unclassified Sinorhizobium]|uniref:RusA family crossover junction endodeoxyribonuclease n=1 Tax=unclassified Sinorhizobium TaxID=2613772 RepID=UPI0035263580
MTARLELPFPLPVSACFENIPKIGRRATQRYREWTNEALWMLKAQKAPRFTGEVSISIGLVAPDKRARDCDNTLKCIMDALVKASVIKDDSNKYVRRVTVQWVPSGAPCTVLISEFEDVAA